MEIFQKKFKFLAKFWKTQKIKYFVEKGFKLWCKMFMKAKPRLSYCFCKVKCAKSQHFSFAGGFAGTPSLAVGLFYTCILQGARQVQGPCCTNPIHEPGGGRGDQFWKLEKVNVSLYYHKQLVFRKGCSKVSRRASRHKLSTPFWAWSWLWGLVLKT